MRNFCCFVHCCIPSSQNNVGTAGVQQKFVEGMNEMPNSSLLADKPESAFICQIMCTVIQLWLIGLVRNL